MMILATMRFLLAVIVLVAAACGAPPPSAAPEVARHDVELTLQSDGSITGLETIDVGDVTSVERVIAPGFFDAIAFVGATVNGVEASRGTSAGSVDVKEDGRSLHVEWTLAPAGKRHQVTLRYRITGALRVEGRQRRLTWTAFAAPRPDAIETARIVLRFPEGVALLMPSGIGEAGWDVIVAPDSLEALRAPLPRDESGTLMALVSGDLFPRVEPEWQITAARAGELAPAFWSGGAFILTVAVGIVGMVWWHDRRTPGRTHLFTRHNAAQLWTAGWIVTLCGLVTGGAAWPLASRYGSAIHSIAIGLVVSGLLFMGTSARAKRHQ